MPSPKKEKRKNQICEYIADYRTENGFSPSIRDICKALDVRSTSTVHSDLIELAEEGRVIINGNKPRSIVIVDEDPCAHCIYRKHGGNNISTVV